MRELWNRWRVAILPVGMTVVVLGALAFFLRSDPAPRPTTPDDGARATAVTAVATTANATATATAALSVPASATSTKPASAWPVPQPIGGEKATWDPSFGDPFESDAGLPSDVRVLVRVGAFRLGVTNDSKVRNEARVLAVLAELGTEIDGLDKGRTDSFEARVTEYAPLLDKYRPKLAPHMDGAFALKGNGWTDTERVIKTEKTAPSGSSVHAP